MTASASPGSSLTIYLTPEQRTALKNQAQRLGVSAREYVVDRLRPGISTHPHLVFRATKKASATAWVFRAEPELRKAVKAEAQRLSMRLNTYAHLCIFGNTRASWRDRPRPSRKRTSTPKEAPSKPRAHRRNASSDDIVEEVWPIRPVAKPKAVRRTRQPDVRPPTKRDDAVASAARELARQFGRSSQWDGIVELVAGFLGEPARGTFLANAFHELHC